MKIQDHMLGDLAVILQGALISCGDEAAIRMSEDVPWQRYSEMHAHRNRLVAWVRRAMAFLLGRMNEPPEVTAIAGKEITRRMYDIAGFGVAAMLMDPVLSPLMSENDRQAAEDGLLSVEDMMDAVSRGMASHAFCPACGAQMMALFSSVECPNCGTDPVKS